MNEAIQTWDRVKWVLDWEWICSGRKVRTACEVGIGPRDISMIPYFRPGMNCSRLIGIEPNPEFLAWAKNEPGIELHAGAVAMTGGRGCLMLNGGSSFMAGNWSPTKADNSTVLEVDQLIFSNIDPGDIDVLNLDCEGGEWAVLSNLISKPKIISIELWRENPDRDKVLNWFNERGYRIRASSGPEGETILWSLN